MEEEMRLTTTLLENDSSIKKLILTALAEDVGLAIKKAIPEIKTEISSILEQALKAEPEYTSLISGQLRYELGIENTNIVDGIVKKLSDTVEIITKNINITSLGITGGLTVTAISSETIGGLLSDSDAIVQDNQRGYSLPWLEWLTLKGTTPIVKNYKVDLGNSPYSRTGGAIMVKEDGSSWSVPPEFAGVQEDNWTIRAVTRIEKDIPNIIINAIEKNI